MVAIIVGVKAVKSKSRPPSFFWRGILILLPLVLLASLGIASLRQDRLLAEASARQRGQSFAENAARGIEAGWRKEESEAFPPLRIDAQWRLLSVGGSPQRASLSDALTPHTFPPGKLSTEQIQRWDTARAAEFRQQPDAIAAWRRFIETGPPAPFVMQADYDLGLLLARRNKGDALRLLETVAGNKEAATESGLPLSLLAQYQRWRLTAQGGEALCSNAVNHPSLVTPVILGEAGDARWRAVWARDEEARDFYEQLRARLGDAPLPRSTFWFFWSNADWLVTIEREQGAEEFGVAGEPRAELAKLAGNNLRADWPNYAEPRVAVAGRDLFDSHPVGPLLAGFSEGEVTVSEYLSRPGLLYADARRRTKWFAALILVSTTAAAIGFVSAWHGFREQVRLGEMKSNFVSSVSHELRAPIASMRLLAEALERGKAPDEVKRKEYFGFLVQESRRLSTLIENVLDFSRIEQGRKSYNFTPTDIGTLLRQTVQLMSPNAAERQVELRLTECDGALPKTFLCDGLTVQQALINLIDNAIKHTPAGGAVAVGHAGGPDQALELWVEDEGPGIPAEEHDRIFERFYRRGSELRRETQGVGIGLSIVQHIVKAHGGRVLVRSAPGQGSRFTLYLPWKPNQAAEY